MSNVEKLYLKRGAVLVKKLNEKGFAAQLVEHKEDVLPLVMSLIPKDDVVAWGGSVTVAQCGVIDAVRKERKVIDRDQAQTLEEKKEIMRKALLCDTFLMGANAVGMDGSLMNIDGTGNRVAALIFGPKQVIVVAGMNKVVAGFNEEMQRAWSLAAPINMERFPDKKCGCSGTGVCVQCNSTDSICNQFVWTRRCNPAGRIKVILVAEDLGY